jgi:hypothetical protein
MSEENQASIGDVDDRKNQAQKMRRIARMLVAWGAAMVVLGMALVLWQ